MLVPMAKSPQTSSLYRGVVVPMHEETERDEGGKVVKARYSVKALWNGRERPGEGTVHMDELHGERTEHNLRTKAQTRAEKRGILAVLGSADPIAEDEE